jgi:hypothetical protein
MPKTEVVLSGNGLIPLEQACRVLELARRHKDVPAAREIREEAAAVTAYLKRRRDLGLQAAQDAAEVKLRAERVLGELLAERVRHQGGRPGKRSQPASVLPEGVSPSDSSRWQQVAKVPAEAFERHLAETRDQGEVASTAAVARLAPRRKPEPPPPAALAPDERWVIERADCLDWFARQPPRSIDLVLGSGPYERARRYLEGGQDPGIARRTEAWVAWMVEVVKAALPCCKAAVVFVVGHGQTKDYRWSGAPALLAADLIRAGVCLRDPKIYHRSGIPGSGGPDDLRKDFEWVLVATNGGRLPWSDNTAMGKPPRPPGGDCTNRRPDGSRENGRGRHTYVPPDLANPGNVIECSVGGGNMGHRLAHESEAPFSEELAEFLIRWLCPPGGIVADCFSGSGTTAAVAKRLGRYFRGCDMRASQVDLTRRRLAEVAEPGGGR